MINMKDIMIIMAILGCIMIVGYIEDPCSTEGLMQGCMD